MRIHYGFNHGDVGKNCIDSVNQGDTFMAPQKKWETIHKHWLGHLCDSFGSSSGLCGFGS